MKNKALFLTLLQALIYTSEGHAMEDDRRGGDRWTREPRCVPEPRDPWREPKPTWPNPRPWNPEPEPRNPWPTRPERPLPQPYGDNFCQIQ